MKRIITAVCLFVLSAAAWSQVAVIRTLPDKGVNPVDPEWSKPSPAAGREGAGPTQLAGRIVLGASGGAGADDQAKYDLYMDGDLSLVQAVGSGALTFGADVLRTGTIDGTEERYQGELGFGFPLWSVSLGGEYHGIEDTDGISASSRLTAASTLGFLETLPITLSVSYGAETDADDDTAELRTAFEAGGTVGRIGVDLEASYEMTDDLAESSRTGQAAGSLAVRVPVLSSLGIVASLSPAYSADGMEIVKLDSLIGLVFTPREGMELEVTGGRNDTWSDTHLARWSMDAGVSAEFPAGLLGSAAYGVSTPPPADPDSPFTHRGEVGFQWVPASAPMGVESAALSAELVYDSAASASIGVSTDLEPISDLRIEAGYDGSFYLESGAASSYEQSADILLRHALHDLLSYELGVGLIHDLDEEGTDSSRSYEGKIVLSPLIAGSRYPFTLSEGILVDPEQGTASSLTVSARFPAGPASRLSYAFTWERLREPEDGVRDTFRHAAGFVLDSSVFAFTADYALAHGIYGVRHDVRSGISIPIAAGFGVRADAELSRYGAGADTSMPFLIRIASTYEF